MKKEQGIKRLLNLVPVLKNKSCFLFGPRQVGKSWLIRHQLPHYKVYNLLDSKVYTALSHSPHRIREEHDKESLIIIDEIQLLPQLLNEVHLMIEEKNVNFLMTGSSARKLRRAGVNLLGGRARLRYLHPFVYKELGQKFNLNQAINKGLIPSIYFSDDADDDLQAYIGEYLSQEIATEAITRNMPAFSRFLEIAGWCHAQQINLTKIANDAQVARTTVNDYFDILKETFIVYELPAYGKTQKRKAVATSKMYFFDNGVARTLQKRKEIIPLSPEYGDFFEAYIFHELKAYCDYKKSGELHYWRSTTQFEVDFILDNRWAIEVKATSNVNVAHLKGLKALREENLMEKYFLVCLEEKPRKVDGIEIVPWKMFLEKLWA